MATITEIKQQLIDCIGEMDKSHFGLGELNMCVNMLSQLSNIAEKSFPDQMAEALNRMSKQTVGIGASAYCHAPEEATDHEQM